MPYKDYNILEPLSPGGTATIYNVEDKDTGEIRVMKITSFEQIQKNIWLNEVNILQKFQYVRGIVKMYEFGEVEDASGSKFGYVVLEKCEKDLFDHAVLPREFKNVFLFLYSVLTSLHSMGYCYCDLKMENILRKGRGFRLCDFSSCQPVGTITNIMYGTPHLMAPELIQRFHEKKEYYYDEKIDTWGLGCIMYEMVSQKKFDRQDIIPVDDKHYESIIKMCLETDPHKRIRIWELSKKMKDLLNLSNLSNPLPNQGIESSFQIYHPQTVSSVLTGPQFVPKLLDLPQMTMQIQNQKIQVNTQDAQYFPPYQSVREEIKQEDVKPSSVLRRLKRRFSRIGSSGVGSVKLKTKPNHVNPNPLKILKQKK